MGAPRVHRDRDTKVRGDELLTRLVAIVVGPGIVVLSSGALRIRIIYPVGEPIYRVRGLTRVGLRLTPNVDAARPDVRYRQAYPARQLLVNAQVPLHQIRLVNVVV